MKFSLNLLTKYVPMQLDLDDQMNENSLLLDSFHFSLFWLANSDKTENRR